jgi:hypothetical protein
VHTPSVNDPTPPDAGPDALLREVHRYLDWSREQTDALDGSDESIWFLQGVLQSMSRDPDERASLRALKCAAYAVYVAELLERTCDGVRMVVDAEGMTAREVLAVGRARLPVLSWVLQCVDDPDADNIVFKYAGGLRDLGEHDRARTVYGQLEEYQQAMADGGGD